MGLLDGNGLLGGGDGGIRQLAAEAGIPEDTKNQPGESYRVPMSPDDFDSFGATLQAAGEEVELASWESSPGTARRWGYGRADAPENQGYIYGKMQNSDGEIIHGTLTYKWRNATGRQTEVNDEAKTEDMNTSSRYNRDEQRPYPEDTDKKRAGPFQELVVMFTPSTPAADITNNYAIDRTASEARWPTTEYDLTAQ
jgi:hypothetical protein